MKETHQRTKQKNETKYVVVIVWERTLTASRDEEKDRNAKQ
jgi:hypothetical protein